MTADLQERVRTVGIVLFDGFELLDVFGPAEMFGLDARRFRLLMLGPVAGPVSSAQGSRVVADRAYGDAAGIDILLVPGGIGTRRSVEDEVLLDCLKALAADADLVCSVCTGAALLARAGLLDGRRATTNKWAMDWVESQGPAVDWVRRARWVEDEGFWSSSGVSAGIDMALAIIESLHGRKVADGLAAGAEYTRQTDPDLDPFARDHAASGG